jgi:hypothetical protein
MHRLWLAVRPQSQGLPDWNRRGYQVKVVEWENGVTLQLYHHQCLVGEVKGVPLSPTTFWLQDIAIANQVNPPIRPRWVMWGARLRNELPQPVNYRGRGLGSILLRQLIAYTRERAFQSLQGQVFRADVENTPYLLQWYRQQGFEILAATEHDPPDLVARLRMSLTATVEATRASDSGYSPASPGHTSHSELGDAVAKFSSE